MKNIEIKDLPLRAKPVSAEKLDKIYGGCEVKANGGRSRI